MNVRAWLLLLILPASFAHAGERWQERPDWRAEFSSRGLAGAALVYDERDGVYLFHDRARVDVPLLPASTFKIFNALVGLETGAVRDEYDVLRWDGRTRWNPDWNRDQSLASGMKFSAVWFYQALARRIGERRMQEWIDRAGYGNRDIGGGIDQFWLSGRLRISAAQQVEFLRRLASGTLPFSERSQEAVRRILTAQAAPDFRLYAKSGWGTHASPDGKSDLGWYVGWVERGGRRWFFAVNVDLPSEGGTERIRTLGAQRTALARALLVRAGALPAAAAAP
jgi:beta-lactamase class D